MIKALLLTALFFCFFTTTNVLAQISNPKAIVKQARRDVLRFKLNKADYQKFKKDRFNPNADYFKPIGNMVRDTALLSDSTYVMAFRYAAYNKTRSRLITNTIIIAGGTTLVVTGVTVAIILRNIRNDFNNGLDNIAFPM